MRGWSLPELVAVIAVLAIVAAIAAPRSFNRDAFAARGYAAELAAAARLSRSIAAASQCPVRLTIDAAGYRARQPPAAGTHCAATSTNFSRTVARGDGTTLDGLLPAGLRFTGNLRWTFNGNGNVQVQGGTVAAVGVQTVRIDAASAAISGP